MSLTYSYDRPVGNATMIQVVFDDGNQTKVFEFEATFTDGVYDADATEATVAAAANTLITKFTTVSDDPMPGA